MINNIITTNRVQSIELDQKKSIILNIAAIRRCGGSLGLPIFRTICGSARARVGRRGGRRRPVPGSVADEILLFIMINEPIP